MNLKCGFLAIALILGTGILHAAEDYQESAEFIALRDSMHHAFNDGDSARFFPALKNLEDYLLKQNDLHAYYTQRCNEIVFMMNQQKIFEAYMLARQLSAELREKNLHKERYMAYNMLGHINRYCGNSKEAKENWHEALRMMEAEGYYANMPPIYMNIVNVALNDDPKEADELLDKAREIAEKYAPERVFDIETRHTLSYYNRGEIDRFLEGYNAYKEGVKKGKSSVHGRIMEVYYLATTGHVDEAVEMARKELGEESSEVIPILYERAGRWHEAYDALKKDYNLQDSIDNVVIINSMEGLRDEIRLYESQRETYRTRLFGLSATILLLLLLIAALFYIVQSRRRHLKELKEALERAKESDKMKAAFIQNISHEIRTPLNVISGFTQVICNPEMTESPEERQHIANMMQKNAHLVSSLLDEIIGLSLIESTTKMKRDDDLKINNCLREQLKDYERIVGEAIKLRYESTLSDDFALRTNASMFNRIISALLDNASKYTEKGYICIRATIDDNILGITVEDTGCGIPADKAEQVFERFVKLDNFKEGIGLGLPLSRKLAEQLGGNLILDIRYTTGARFVVKIPISKI